MGMYSKVSSIDKRIIYLIAAFSFFVALFLSFMAQAQSGQVGVDPGYPLEVQRFYYNRGDGRLYGDMRSQINRSNLPYSQADGAWARQWAPWEKVTGISTSTARSFVEAFKAKFKQDTTEAFGNISDWGVIVGTSGLIDSFGEASSELFGKVVDGTPQSVAGRDPNAPSYYQYVPEEWGYRDMYYPPEGLNYQHAFTP